LQMPRREGRAPVSASKETEPRPIMMGNKNRAVSARLNEVGILLLYL